MKELEKEVSLDELDLAAGGVPDIPGADDKAPLHEIKPHRKPVEPPKPYRKPLFD